MTAVKTAVTAARADAKVVKTVMTLNVETYVTRVFTAVALAFAAVALVFTVVM